MKTAIAALLLSGTALTPALAQDCTSPTRCTELGYTMSKDDCDGIKSLVCPFDSSKYFCVEAGDSAAGPAPGMILYSDGTVSDSVFSNKTPVGIVAYVDENRRFAIALEESSSLLWWSTPTDENLSCLTDYSSSSQVQSDFNGASNTQCIVNYSSSNSYPAAEYCNTYKPVSSGTGSSGWYLPATGELYVMKDTRRLINLGLNKLSKAQLQSGYRSSSEANNGYTWDVNFSDGGIYTVKKVDRGYVRCILAF